MNRSPDTSKFINTANPSQFNEQEIGHIMDRFLTWAIILGIFFAGLWAADKKERENAANPPQYSTPFMYCMSLPDYRQKTDCLDRAGLGDMDTEDPKDEARRR